MCMTKTDIKKVLGVTPPDETLTIIDRKTGIRIIIEPYMKGKGVSLTVNKKITLKQIMKITNPNRSIFRMKKKYRRKYL